MADAQLDSKGIVTVCPSCGQRNRLAYSKLRAEFSGLRTEFSELRTDVRVEISGLRTEMATQRFELLKWMFLFWVGQFVSVVGFVGLMLRMRP